MGQAERKVYELDKLKAQYRQRWGTPRSVPHNLARIFGDHWTIGLDVCAEDWSAKASRYYGPGSSLREDALMPGLGRRQAARRWVHDARGQAMLCNMPFESISPWVDLGLASAREGGHGILWMPPRTDRDWWRTLVKHQHAQVVWVEGRVDHEVPPPLALAYAQAGLRPSGNGGPIVMWFFHHDPALLPPRDVVIHRDALVRQPSLPGLA